MRERVEKVIEKIRPALQADGGDIELVEVKDNVVTVELVGVQGLPDVADDAAHGRRARH